MKRKISLIMVLVLVLTAIFSINASAKTPTVFYQKNNKDWSGYPYKASGYPKATIGSGGCGLLSVTNAVYHLTGNFLEPTMLADYAQKTGDRVSGGTSDTFLEHVAEKYGEKYGFKYVGTTNKESKLKKTLQNNGAAVWHKPKHFLAIVEYNPSKDKYLILDSDPGSISGTSDGYEWKTFSQIESLGIRSAFGCKGFMLIQKTSSSSAPNEKEPEKAKTIKWPATKNIKTYVISTGNDTTVYETATSTKKYGTIYAEDLITILGYSGSRLKVKYPVTGTNKYKEGYIKASAVTSSEINVATSKKTATSKMTTYRRSSGKAETGYISKGDIYYQIATKNGRKQVIYPITGGYKIGWIE